MYILDMVCVMLRLMCKHSASVMALQHYGVCVCVKLHVPGMAYTCRYYMCIKAIGIIAKYMCMYHCQLPTTFLNPPIHHCKCMYM